MAKRPGSTLSVRRMQALRDARLRINDTCHICGHPGSDVLDHIVPLARGGSDDPANLAPAHHNTECPDCGRRCNREKGAKNHAPIIRRSGTLNR